MNKKINFASCIRAIKNSGFDEIFTELLIKTRKKLTLSLIILNVPFFLFAQTWEYRGLGTEFISSIYVKNDTIYAGTMSYTPILYRSIDLGLSWDTIASVNLNVYIDIPSIISHKETLFFGTHRYGLFRSTDNGISWEQKDNGLADLFDAQALVIGDNDHLIAAGSAPRGSTCNCIFESNDNGENWSSISSGIPVNTSIYGVKINTAGHIFAYGSSFGQKIWRSTDNAATWVQLPDPYTSPNASAWYSLDIDSLGNLFLGSGSTIYLSSDNGNNWSPLFTFPENVSKIKLNKKTGLMYTVTRDSANHYSIYHSEDNGNNWTNISNGFPDTSFVTAIEFDVSDNVYMGTPNGIYKLNVLNTALPKMANTEQLNIYPNPFSDQFSIDGLTGENTTINIYNLTGKKIYSAGVYCSSTSIDLSPFNNGIYLLQLINSKKTVLKKIIKE